MAHKILLSAVSSVPFFLTRMISSRRTKSWSQSNGIGGTAEEREDLDYLVQRQRRMGSDAAPGRPTATSARMDAPTAGLAVNGGNSARGRTADDDEDQML